MGISIILITVLGFTPILRSGLYSLAIGLIATIAVIYNLQNNEYRKHIPLLVNVCLYLSIVLGYHLVGITDIPIVLTLRHAFFFIPILLMLLMPQTLSEKHRKWLLLLAIMVVLINIADNIRLCIIHPEFLLKVNRDTDGADMIGEVTNIGGSKFYNALFFFFLVCLFIALNTKRKLAKYAILGCAIFSAVFVLFFCLKASVMVFVVLSAILLVYAKRMGNMHRFVVGIILFGLFAFFVVTLFSDLIVDTIASSISSKRLEERLIMLVDSENDDATAGVGTVSARAHLWLVSIETWLSGPVNFLMGIGDHRAEIQETTGIGMHSEICDLLAKYGLIGFFLFMNTLRLCYKYFISLFGDDYKLQFQLIFVILLLFGLTKGICLPGIGCTLFLILPLSAKFLIEDKTLQQ